MVEAKVGEQVSGPITHVDIHGVFVDIGAANDALLHRSQFKQADFRAVTDVYKVGDKVEAFILKVDADSGMIALTANAPLALPWDDIRMNQAYTGKVTRIESYGAFVDIGAERPGMVHVSEMADGYISSPGEVVKVGEEVEVRILKLNRKRKQIDLTMKEPVEEIVQEPESAEPVETAMQLAFRRAMEGQSESREDQAEEARAVEKNRKQARIQEEILARTLVNHDPTK
jgi:small subunit ribosomal protein S1